jgi:hypothetical protein
MSKPSLETVLMLIMMLIAVCCLAYCDGDALVFGDVTEITDGQHG